MSLQSQIYRGKVSHTRLSPTAHTFDYSATFFSFDLQEIPKLSERASLFGHNEFRPLSIYDQDFLYGKQQGILEQLEQTLPNAGATQNIVITSPRYFGYAFNPVNFHLRMRGDELLSVVAEVNNTFGDRHVYPLVDLKKVDGHCWTAVCAKDFHVSPFNNMAGEYHFTFRIELNKIFLGIDLYREQKCVLKTWISGKAKPLSNAAIWRYALLHPFDTALNSMPRILWQAALLYYKKKLRIYTRPSPESEQTLIDSEQSQSEQKVI